MKTRYVVGLFVLWPVVVLLLILAWPLIPFINWIGREAGREIDKTEPQKPRYMPSPF